MVDGREPKLEAKYLMQQGDDVEMEQDTKKLMRSITSKELSIAECKSSGTVNFNHVLIIILDFHNFATTIPTG